MMASFTINIQVDETVDAPGDWLEMLETAATATLRYEQIAPPVALTLLLTDDEQLHQLNRDFLGVDKPTDVLSFPSGESPGAKVPYLGDIAISVPYAIRQAQVGGHALTAELQLLTIHGVLHLLGHDHARPEEKAKMWAAQTAVLTQLGLQDIQPTES